MEATRLNDPYLIGRKRGSTPDGQPPVGGLPSIPVPDMDGLVMPVSLDGRSFTVDMSRQAGPQERFKRQSVQLLNSQQNIDKGESALTTPEVWRRTYKSWHHGMGQKFADRSDSDEYRYDWSKGIDPWTRWQIGLLHDTAEVSGGAMATADGVSVNGFAAFLAADRQSLFVTDGTRTGTYTGFTEEQVIASDGKHIYCLGKTTHTLKTMLVSLVDATPTVTQHTSVTIPATSPFTLLVFANFKLIGTTAAGVVYDLTEFLSANPPTAMPDDTWTPPLPNVTFVGGCSGKNAIFLLANVGDRGTVHAFDIVRDSAKGKLDSLIYSGVVAELPDGEQGAAIYSYLGYVALGTSKGFRFSAQGQGITYGPLIETSRPVTAFEGQGRFLYYALADYRGDSGVGRADLSEFVADLQPAYASDLHAVDASAAGHVTFITTLPSGKLVFGLSDAGVWQEQDTYVPAGEITLSGWTFNVVDPKKGLYITTQTSTDSGGTGTLYARFDQSNNEVLIGEYVTSHQRFSMLGAMFYSVALHARIAPNPERTLTPRVYSAEMRATYTRGKASEWQVPCLLHDEVEADNGAVISRDVLDDYRHLMFLVESGKEFLYVEDGHQWTVYATDFIWSPQERSQSAGWQGVFTIYFREVR